MERADADLSVREAVLLVVSAAGGRIEGRTAAQKLCYFASIALGHGLGHSAHYYGPYSRAVENVLSDSAFAGDLDQNVQRIGTGHQYTYTLTDQGQDAVADLRGRHADAAARIDHIVTGLGELAPGFPQHPLSMAAKVDFIVSQQGGTTTTTAIPDLAQQLGWNLTSADVKRAVDILVGVKRLTTS